MNVEKFIPIETDRLLLDRFTFEDWKDLYAMEITPEQHRYNGESFNPRSKLQVQSDTELLAQQDYNSKKLPFLLVVRTKEDGRLIGYIGFKKGEKITENGTVEVYYSIHVNQWNKGYATEALKAMLSFGFKDLKLHRIISGCDIDNIASKCVMEKAGMRFESRWRKDRQRNGVWTDGLGFAALEEDLLRLPSLEQV